VYQQDLVLEIVAIVIGVIFSSSCLEEYLEHEDEGQDVLILTGSQELFGILIEVISKALEILSRVGEDIVSSEESFNVVEAFDRGRLYQQDHLYPSESEAIIRFKTFQYLLIKALVKAINEKVASCLVVFPVALVKVGSDGHGGNSRFV
jgi:hypothetical protein